MSNTTAQRFVDPDTTDDPVATPLSGEDLIEPDGRTGMYQAKRLRAAQS